MTYQERRSRSALKLLYCCNLSQVLARTPAHACAVEAGRLLHKPALAELSVHRKDAHGRAVDVGLVARLPGGPQVCAALKGGPARV